MKMAKITFSYTIILLLFSSAVTPRETTEGVELSERWHRLNDLLVEEINTIKTVRNPGGNLLHRLVELKTQRIELEHERENKEYLFQAVELGNPNNKSRQDFFHTSRNLYKEALNTGLRITEDYPNYQRLDEVYYALALNERDYNRSNRIEEFLNQALRIARNNESRHKILVELAEYYYNEKRFDEAITAYNIVIRNSNDEWLAKHHFNLAWCLYQTNQRNKGIDHLLKSFNYGEKKQYISLEEQVTNSLALFYIQTQRENEGIEFLSKLPTPENLRSLTYMTNLAQSQGSYEQTIKVLEKTLSLSRNYARSNENNAPSSYAHLLTIKNIALDIYRNSKEYNKFRAITEEIKELYLNGYYENENDPLRQQAIEKVRGLAGFFQENVSRQAKFYPDQFKNLNNPILARALYFLNILTELHPEKSYEYYFFIGETLASSNHFERALEQYRVSFEDGLQRLRQGKEEQLEQLEKTMDSILATLGELEVNRSQFEKNNNWAYTRYAYRHHLNLWPTSERSKRIYPKLFNIKMGLNRYSNAENLIANFNRNFPNEIEKQQIMAIEVMDTYVELKMPENVNSWINIISNGFLSFDQTYISRSIEVLGNLLFQQYRQNENKLTHEELFEGYKKIYGNDIYPDPIRTEAAFHLSRISIENYNPTDAYIWMNKVFEIIPEQELKVFAPSIASIINRIANQGRFGLSIELNFNYLIKFNLISPSDVLDQTFDQLVKYSLIDNKETDLINMIEKLSQKAFIGSNQKDEVIKKLLSQSLTYKDFRLFQVSMEKFWRYEHHRKQIASILIDFYWDDRTKNSRRANNILRRLNQIKDLPGIIASQRSEITHINQYNSKVQKINELLNSNLSPQALESRFPKHFNSDTFIEEFELALDYVFDSIEKVQEIGNSILQKGHPETIATPYAHMANAYLIAGEFLKSYSPKNVPVEIQPLLEDQVWEVISFLFDEQDQIIVTGKQTLKSSNILSNTNFILMSPISRKLPETSFEAKHYATSRDRDLTETRNAALKKSFAGNKL